MITNDNKNNNNRPANHVARICHMAVSFCDGTKLCSIAYQNLEPVPEKSGTRLTDTRASFWYQFLLLVSPA